MAKEKTGLGYMCQCGHWSPCENGWAAAHWHEELLHTCAGCGVRMLIKGGECLGPEDESEE